MTLVPLLCVALLGMALTRSVAGLVVSVPVAGASWTAVSAVLLATAQQMLPGWVRARGLAFFFMGSQGGMALGSLFWGVVAGRSTPSVALAAASVAVLAGGYLAFRGWIPEADGPGAAS
jgi:hypothetical protein